MRTKLWLSAITLALAAGTAAADNKVAAIDTSKQKAAKELTVDAIVRKHIAALGGEKLLRAGKTITFTVSGEKMGKKFTKTVHQARPNKLRVDVTGDDGNLSKGFDGKVAWVKKGSEPAIALSAEDTASMAAHSQFEEPLLDYAKKGMKVTLVGKTEVDAKPAYDLEVTLEGGEIEHHLLDASSFLLVKRTFTGKGKDGKATKMAVRFGDYKNVQGRMVNHSVTWEGDDGKLYTNAVTNVKFDKPMHAKLFAMPK